MNRIFNFGRVAAFTAFGALALGFGKPASAELVTVDFEDLTGLYKRFTYVRGVADTREFGILKISDGQALTLVDNDGNENNVYAAGRRNWCYGCTWAITLDFDDTATVLKESVDQIVLKLTNPHNSIREYWFTINESSRVLYTVDQLATVEFALKPGDFGVKGFTTIKIHDRRLAWFYIDDIQFDDGVVANKPSIISFRTFIPADNAPAAPNVSCVALPERAAGGMARAPTVVRGVSSSPDSAERRALYVAGDGDNPDSHRVFQSVAVIPDGDINAEGYIDTSIKNETADMDFYAGDALSGGKFSVLALADAEGGDCHWYHQTHALASDTMAIEPARAASDLVSVRFSGSVDTPLAGKAGKDALDWDVRVTLDTEGEWTVSGAHDGFPAYAVYIDGVEVYASESGERTYSSYNADIRKQIRSMDVRAEASGTLQ